MKRLALSVHWTRVLLLCALFAHMRASADSAPVYQEPGFNSFREQVTQNEVYDSYSLVTH